MPLHSSSKASLLLGTNFKLHHAQFSLATAEHCLLTFQEAQGEREKENLVYKGDGLQLCMELQESLKKIAFLKKKFC